MKIIISIALLCITFIAFTQEQKKNNKIKVITSWEGRPRCNGGHGLCAIKSSSITGQTNTTIIYYDTNKMDFIINRSKITKEEEIKIVGKDLAVTVENEFIYIFEEDYALDTEIQTSLKLSAECIKIPIGSYPILVTKDTLTITFTLE